MFTLTKHTTTDHHTGGPYTYYETIAAIIGVASNTNGHYGGYGDIIRKAALFMELLDYYRLPELTITMNPTTTITIRKTP